MYRRKLSEDQGTHDRREKDLRLLREGRQHAFDLRVAENEVRGAFGRHYTRTPGGPSESEEFMYRDSDLTFYREGDPGLLPVSLTPCLER
jgi:hypothetical protein